MLTKKKKEETNFEIIEGLVENIVDCAITLRVHDYFLTLPTYRILEIKHKQIGAGFGFENIIKGQKVELTVKKKEFTNCVSEKW